MPQPSATNDFQFAKMGLQLGSYVPGWGAPVGAALGLGADLLMGRENQSGFLKAQAERGLEQFKRTHFNPYEGGYNQGRGGFRYGGPSRGINEATTIPVRMTPIRDLYWDQALPIMQLMPARRIYPEPRFKSTQDRQREQQREFERDELRRAQEIYKKSLPSFSFGGPATAQHIIPENMAMEAVQRGDDMAIVPGMGTGTEDNIRMGGIRVSSGEGVMSDEAMREAAFNQGIAYSDFMMRNYPNTTKLLRRTGHFAYGGPAKGRPDYDLARARELGYSPDGMGHMPSRDYMTGRILKEPFHPTFQTGIEEDRKLGYNPMIGTDGKVYTVSPNDIPSEGPFAPSGFARSRPLKKEDGYVAGGPYSEFLAMPLTPMLDQAKLAAEKMYPLPVRGTDKPPLFSGKRPDPKISKEKSDFDMEGLDKMNNASAIASGALGLGSALYSAFQKRSIPPPPEEYKPQLLDLKTGAFANALEDRRKGAQVTGLYNFRGRQSLGGELGVLSAGLRQRNADAAAVEQVKNRQEEYNNQLINNAELGNIQRRDAYNQAQGEAQDRFRAMKGAAVSAGLNTMINAGSQWMQNRLVADAAATQAGLYGGYSLWQSGKSNDSIDELTNYQFNRRKN